MAVYRRKERSRWEVDDPTLIDRLAEMATAFTKGSMLSGPGYARTLSEAISQLKKSE